MKFIETSILRFVVRQNIKLDDIIEDIDSELRSKKTYKQTRLDSNDTKYIHTATGR
jgi:hypothetical protein